MQQALVKTKKIGKSLGVILPKDLVQKENLKSREEVLITIERKQNVLKEMFGAIKFKRPIEEIIKESRKGESKWL